MNPTTIARRVCTTVSLALGAPVALDESAKDWPEWDSLGHLAIMVALEKEFDVKFDTEEIMRNMSLDELCTLVERTVG